MTLCRYNETGANTLAVYVSFNPKGEATAVNLIPTSIHLMFLWLTLYLFGLTTQS